ncbi:MAG TPA: hypothetical protein VIY54_00535 [Steroidobacteraceae bacterium]
MGRESAPPDHITPYDRFAWSDTDIEQLLAHGRNPRELIAYFGAAEYRDLVRLAQLGARTPTSDHAVRVFVVPGIMGSQLGLRRPPPLPNDILWLDPIDIGVGRLAALHVPTGAPIVPLGVVLYSYLRLKLHLRARGFAPLLYDYDWRLGVDELGPQLAAAIRADPAQRTMIVAHSMGGLVSRAALAQPGLRKVERVVLLGTPNSGSFAPLQALRGTYAVVRKIARLTTRQSAEALADKIFNSFPSLYQMLPVRTRSSEPDLFDAAQWPRRGPQPDAGLLRAARDIHGKLAPADERICAIVGVGQETVTAARRHRDQFIYTVTRHGDGTVPALSAALPGAQMHYATVPHSELTRHPIVAAAVTELLATGTTLRLKSEWQTSSTAEAHVSDAQLRRMQADKVDWARLEANERRQFLQNLNEPPKLHLRVPKRTKQRTAVRRRQRKPSFR